MNVSVDELFVARAKNGDCDSDDDLVPGRVVSSFRPIPNEMSRYIGFMAYVGAGSLSAEV